MRKYLEVALGIFTSIGGFLEVGAIATTAQAGARFGLRLAWVLLLGTICVIFLVEMSGRLSAVSKHTLQDAMRERFGAGFFVVTTIPGLVVDWLVLASEIGGGALAPPLGDRVGLPVVGIPGGHRRLAPPVEGQSGPGGERRRHAGTGGARVRRGGGPAAPSAPRAGRGLAAEPPPRRRGELLVPRRQHPWGADQSLPLLL